MSAADESFDAALSRAVAAQALTLERLSARLRSLGTPVSIATLSYWQSGRSVPTRARSLAAVEHLETILALPPGHLTSALAREAGSRWDPMAALAPDDRIRRAIDEMGLDLNRHMATLSIYDSLRISPDGRHHRRTTQQLVRSEQDGLRSVLLVLASDGADNPPMVEAGPGCSLGQVTVLEDISTVVAELLLPTVLQAGDLSVVEYRTQEYFPRSTASMERQSASSLPYLVLDVTFEGAAPLRAEYQYLARADVDPDEIVCRTLPVGSYLQVALADAPAGVHAIAWTHEDELEPGHVRV